MLSALRKLWTPRRSLWLPPRDRWGNIRFSPGKCCGCGCELCLANTASVNYTATISGVALNAEPEMQCAGCLDLNDTWLLPFAPTEGNPKCRWADTFDNPAHPCDFGGGAFESSATIFMGYALFTLGDGTVLQQFQIQGLLGATTHGWTKIYDPDTKLDCSDPVTFTYADLNPQTPSVCDLTGMTILIEPAP